MRKIWSRKDKDKRRLWTGAASVVSASEIQLVALLAEEDEINYGHSSNDSNENLTGQNASYSNGIGHGHKLINSNGSSGLNDLSTPNSQLHVLKLIRPEYDHNLIKNSWINVIINTHTLDVREELLRLFRAELKGLHLYLYKMLPSMQAIRSFKIEDDLRDDITLASQNQNQWNNKNLLTTSNHDLNNNNKNNTASVPSGLENNTDDGSVPVRPPALNLLLQNNSNTLLTSSGGISGTMQSPNLTATAINGPTQSTSSSNANGASNSGNQPFLLQHQNNLHNTIQSLIFEEKILTTLEEEEEEVTILHWDADVPHPDFVYEDSLHLFGTSSKEAYIHHILFAPESDIDFDSDETNNNNINNNNTNNNDENNNNNDNDLDGNNLDDNHSVRRLITVLPMFPDFEKLLRLLNLFIELIGARKFTCDIANVLKRIIMLLQNILDNFTGFLVYGDVGPAVLRVLQLALILNRSNNNQPKLREILIDLERLKREMLTRQLQLTGLINDTPACEPFMALNLTNFLQSINLVDLAHTISSIDLEFFRKWNASWDKLLLLTSNLDFCAMKNPLVFTENHIHYLGRLFIQHIFLETGLLSQSFERKAKLIEKWIDLGCILDKMGNMLLWIGIAQVVLSQPCLRLARIWLLVAPDYIKLLKNDWLPVLFELERRYLTNGVKLQLENEDLLKDSFHIMAPRGLGKLYRKESVVPYFGDLNIHLSPNIPVNVNELVTIWKKINYSFNRWNEYLANLANKSEIIQFNANVLRRYDQMGFILLNESLNQVLFLGTLDDSQPPEIVDDAVTTPPLEPRVDKEIVRHLTRLLEINTKLTSLEKIMEYLLVLEPPLPEQYSLVSQSIVNFGKPNMINIRNGLISLMTLVDLSVPTIAEKITLDSASLRIPLFNNSYFKLNLLKYDDLVERESSNGSSVSNIQNTLTGDPKRNFVVDSKLIFRADDLISEAENESIIQGEIHEYDEIEGGDMEEDVGLGIDVDDILNSDKFNNLLIDLTRPNSTSKSTIGAVVSGSYTANRTLNGELTTTELLTGGPMLSVVASGGTKYIPKYATIDRLIDLLLINVRYFNDDLKMDLNEYRFIFLLNYELFITTRDLLTKLIHRFINLGNAVILIMKRQWLAFKKSQKEDVVEEDSEFVNWDIDENVDLTELGEVDYELLIKIQINILKVLIVLLNNFYALFSADLTNKGALVKLLKLYLNEILQWYNLNKINDRLELPFELLVNYYKRLKKLFIKKLYRPAELGKFDEYLIHEFRFLNLLHEVPINRNLPGHKNIGKIEKFLHKFNKLLALFYRGIRTEDWIRVFKVLECAFENNSLLDFNLQKNSISDDNLVILNVFQFLESLIDTREKLLVVKKFPLIFRKLFKLYHKFKIYLLIQLTDPAISVEERLDRMKTLLLMVKTSRLKMKEHPFVFEGVKSEVIPLCVETAITNVIYSPESRALSGLWQRAASALGTIKNDFDNLTLLLPSLSVTDLQMSHEPLLPCFGWIIENFIDINKIPLWVPNKLSLEIGVENSSWGEGDEIASQPRVNFNKRYLVFKLIKEFAIEEVDEEVNYHDTREFEFLLKLDETLARKQLQLREYSGLNETTPMTKEKVKLFRAVLKEQHRILIIDNKKKSAKDAFFNNHLQLVQLETSNATTLAGNPTNTLNGGQIHATVLPGTLNKKGLLLLLRRQSMQYKLSLQLRFKISGLFNKTRSFAVPSADKTIGVRELPAPEQLIDQKQKPYLIIPMRNKKIFPVYLLPYLFKIDSDNSNEDYLIQTLNDVDMNDWLMKLGRANRHWFYSKNLNLKVSSPNVTFGLPILFVCAREGLRCPSFIQEIFSIIEQEGIKDVGIYRISSLYSDLNMAKQIIDRDGHLDFATKSYDVHTLTSLVKHYLRELPDALLTDFVILRFYEVKQKQYNIGQEQDGGEDGKISPERALEIEIKAYKEVVQGLPTNNYHTLRVLLKHLQKVTQFSENNKMHSLNIATVIGPALTEASMLEELVNNFGFINLILDKLIVNFTEVFDEPIEEIEPTGSLIDKLPTGELKGEVDRSPEMVHEETLAPLTNNTRLSMPEPNLDGSAKPSPKEIEMTSQFEGANNQEPSTPELEQENLEEEKDEAEERPIKEVVEMQVNPEEEPLKETKLTGTT